METLSRLPSGSAEFPRENHHPQDQYITRRAMICLLILKPAAPILQENQQTDHYPSRYCTTAILSGLQWPLCQHSLVFAHPPTTTTCHPSWRNSRPWWRYTYCVFCLDFDILVTLSMSPALPNLFCPIISARPREPASLLCSRGYKCSPFSRITLARCVDCRGLGKDCQIKHMEEFSYHRLISLFWTVWNGLVLKVTLSVKFQAKREFN